MNKKAVTWLIVSVAVLLSFSMLMMMWRVGFPIMGAFLVIGFWTFECFFVNRAWSPLPKWLVRILLLLFGASVFAYAALRILHGHNIAGLSVFVNYAMGFFSLLLTFTLIGIALLVGRNFLLKGMAILRKNKPETALNSSNLNKNIEKMPRREFFGRSIRLGVLGSASGVFAYGAYKGAGEPTLLPVEVSIVDLPLALQGLKIVQLSDIHVGQLRDQAQYLERVVQMVNAQDPDIVAVTGDVVDGSVATLAPHVKILGKIRSKHGVFFCTGNHEYYSGVLEWLDYFASLGWQVLGNRHCVIPIQTPQGSAQLVVAGVHDWSANRHIPAHTCDHKAALENAPIGQDVCRVLLAHQPKTALFLNPKYGVHLQLSGHTHAGQYFPGTWLIGLAQQYVQGLNRRYRNDPDPNSTQIYVNRGTGYWGPALRTTDIVGEVTLLTLKRAA